MTLYILQYEYYPTDTVVVGVYDNMNDLYGAAKEWYEKDSVGILFYDTKNLNETPTWSNNQLTIPRERQI